MSIQSTGLGDPEKKGGQGGWRILDGRWDGRTTFTVDECAEILRISRCSAYAAVKNKEIPVVWIGRRAIVPRAALEKMLNVA